MSRPQWPPRYRLIDRLLAEPHRFRFFQAVRLLSHQVRLSEGLDADRVVGERIRFGSSLSLSFPPSEVEQLAEHATGSAKPGRYRMVPAFIGMVGPGGALPRRYTEMLVERAHLHRDRTGHAFVDIFTNRMVSLFYRAWLKHRLPMRHELGQRFRSELLSLAGYRLGFDERATNEQVPLEPYAAYAGLLRHQPVSAENLRRVIADQFGTAVQVEQFVGQWFDIPPTQQTSLGGANAVIGESACAGARLWDRQIRLRITIGPLRRERYRAMLPDGRAIRVLRELVNYWCGATVEFEICPLLHKDDVVPARLDGQSGQLGRDAVCLSRPLADHLGEARFLLN